MNFLIWLEQSTIGVWVAESIWGYPIVLSSHAVGMAIVVGTVMMISLRILGFARDVPVTLFYNLSLIAWIGVGLNVLSGLALFCGDPIKFFFSLVFWTKILLIILGSISVWLALRSTQELNQTNMDIPEVPTRVKVLASLSLLFWPCAIIAGRLVAYIDV